MSDYYETIGRILASSFSSEIDPFEVANKKNASRRKSFSSKEDIECSTDNFKSFSKEQNVNRRVPVPSYLLEDFAILNVLPGVGLEECKSAWKVLLKKYHPDLSDENKTSDVVIRLNASYRRIEQWFNGNETLS